MNNSKVLQHIGALSYPVYLFHYPIMFKVCQYTNTIWLKTLIVVITSFILSIIVNTITKKVIQMYCNKHKLLSVISVAIVVVLFALITYLPQNETTLTTEAQAEEVIATLQDSTSIIDKTQTNTLYIPTMISKYDSTYFINDCWNHRVIYNTSLDNDLNTWLTLTDAGYIGGHTIAYDGEVYLLDNTDASEVLVYKKTNDGIFVKTQTIYGVTGRPHCCVYDSDRERFLVIGSTVGKIYIFKNKDGIVDWTDTVILDEIKDSYVRSISIIDNQLYTVSGPGSICVYDMSDDGSFSLRCQYTVPDKYYGMNGIYKFGSYYYVTVNTDASGDVNAATVFRVKDLADIENGNEEIIKNTLNISTQPYFISHFDNTYYCPYISSESANGIVSFDIDEHDNIINVHTLWDFVPNDTVKEQHQSKYANNSQTVDLFLFAGQSNMAGHGNYEEAPTVNFGYEFRAVTDTSQLYPITEPFGLYENKENGINDTWENMTVLRKTGSLVSSFANAYFDTTGIPIVAVSCSEGATTIDEWLPGTHRYADLQTRYEAAKTFLDNNDDFTLRNTYLVWCQGESDGDNGISADEYITRLDTLVNSAIDMGIDNVLFIRIGNNRDNESLYDSIIEAQTEYCHTHDTCVLISTRFAEMSHTGLMCDTYHYTQTGYNLVGEEAGYNAGYYSNTHLEPNLYDYKYECQYIGH